ncbi:LOW QUALITY PROTEIN: (E3-independent) E2 ubiquitin-conjugating enzyme UBE2O-like [Liolophura sinensis]|uniref:LOW QUALITY PROTEIN: (E3-independent) E2 ubiquitin-conjugating enzyme UBE2O-like n=1 Tax=Liolophura sinensis TaxID=3198878 RepID=UPI0031587E01
MADCRLFEEDEVCVSTSEKGILYGLVTQNSEYVSSDEDSDSEDTPQRVKRGTVEVTWHPGGEGKEVILPEKDLCLADRSLMPGDVVRRLIEGKDSQRGYVVDLQGQSHLRVLGVDKYIYDVSTKDVMPLQMVETDPGDVTMDSWVGKVDSIDRNLTLRFPDGARCEVPEAQLYTFVDAVDKRKPSEYCVYYPGQVLKGRMHELAFAKWLQSTNRFNFRCCMKKPQQMVTVYVEKTGKFLTLHKKLMSDTVTDSNMTSLLQPLESFACSVQLGDRCYYVIKPTDVLETKAPCWFPPLHLKHLLEQTNYVPPSQHQEDTSSSKSTRMNNTTETNVASAAEGYDDKSSKNFSPVHTSSACNLEEFHKHVKTEAASPCSDDKNQGNAETDLGCGDAEEYTSESSSTDDSDHSSGSLSNTRKRKNQRRKGGAVTANFRRKAKVLRAQKDIPFPEISANVGDKVTVDVCYTYSVATIMWQDGTVEKNVPSVDLYPIHHLDELEFFPGDYVLNNKDTGDSTEYGVVVKCDHAERTCLLKHMKAYEVGKATEPIEVKPASEVSVYDIKDHPYYKFRPGHVVIRVGGFEAATGPLEAAGLVLESNPDGRITVKWPDGSISHCYPQELYIASGDLSEFGSDSEWTSDSESGSGSESDQSWETEDEEVLDEVNSEDLKKIQAREDKTRTHVKISLTLEKLEELSKMLTRSRDVLERCDHTLGTLNQEMEISDSLLGVASIFQDIVKICKHFDKIWKTSFFKDAGTQLNELIRTLKREIHRESSLRSARYLSQMLSAPKGGQENNTKIKQDKNKNFPPVNNHVIKSRSENVSESVGKCVECKCMDKSITEPVVNGEQPVENGEQMVENGEQMVENGQMTNGAIKCSACSGAAEAGGADASVGEKYASDKTPCSPTAPYFKARSLCQTIYSLLGAKMKQMQDEVNTEYLQQKPSTGLDAEKESGVKRENGMTTLETAEFSMETSVNGQENVTVSTDTGTEGAAAPCPPKPGLEGVITDLLNHLFVANSTTDSEDSKLLSRYKEVEDVASPLADSPSQKSATKGFDICESVPASHKFKHGKPHSPDNPKAFMAAVRKELSLLKSSLPEGIFVKTFEDRMDLFSIMIVGPANTPYEDGLFFFDVQLPSDYPKEPPLFHYLSYCPDRLNPNLYEDGKVCVSLLGTWSGKDNEMWTNQSNLLQVLISIQGLILVSEPYYNEAGFEKQRGSQQGHENSKMYNEMAALKLMQSMAGIASRPPVVFHTEAQQHILATGPRMIKRVEGWVRQSKSGRMSHAATPQTPVDSVRVVENSTSAGTTREELVQDEHSGDNSYARSLTDVEKDKSSQIGDDQHANGPVGVMSPDNVSGRVIPHKGSSYDKPDLDTVPEFPLLPASKGFCMTICKHLDDLRNAIDSIKGS